VLSAAAAAWLTERKGYGERLGLTFGLVLSAVGLLIALVSAALLRNPRFLSARSRAIA